MLPSISDLLRLALQLKEFGARGVWVASSEMEASLRSCTFLGSNIGAGAPTLPFPAASSRLLRASSSRARRLELCNCRVSSSEQGGDGEEVGPGKEGITLERFVVRDRFRTISGIIELNFGSTRSDDRLHSSPLPDFEDEFFARMMALEASRLSSSRASSTSAGSFFEGVTLCAGCELPRPSSGLGVEVSQGNGDAQREVGVLGKGGVQLPPSIKKLRRRKSEVGESRLVLSGCAIKRAFSSMMYMIKAVQSHALQIRQALFCDKWDVQQVLHLVDREMQSSFVWLFQRVFACTPTLMVSVMILLANFTAFSTGENVAGASVTETPPAIAHTLSSRPVNPQPVPSPIPHTDASFPTLFSLPGSGYGGKNTFPPAPTTQGSDGADSWRNGVDPDGRYGFSKNESPMTDMAKPSHREMMRAWVESTMRIQRTQLEQETTQRLVAPVVAHLESDKYACFDRTDLEYQLALAKDPGSAVLLSNFAQFLFVVRRDNDRYVSSNLSQCSSVSLAWPLARSLNCKAN